MNERAIYCGHLLRRVSYHQAKVAYSRNIGVFIVPCNLRLDNLVYPATRIPERSYYSKLDSNESFDTFVNEYRYYCCNTSTGKYPWYYIVEKEVISLADKLKGIL